MHEQVTNVETPEFPGSSEEKKAPKSTLNNQDPDSKPQNNNPEAPNDTQSNQPNEPSNTETSKKTGKTAATKQIQIETNSKVNAMKFFCDMNKIEKGNQEDDLTKFNKVQDNLESLSPIHKGAENELVTVDIKIPKESLFSSEHSGFIEKDQGMTTMDLEEITRELAEKLDNVLPALSNSIQITQKTTQALEEKVEQIKERIDKCFEELASFLDQKKLETFDKVSTINEDFKKKLKDYEALIQTRIDDLEKSKNTLGSMAPLRDQINKKDNNIDPQSISELLMMKEQVLQSIKRAQALGNFEKVCLEEKDKFGLKVDREALKIEKNVETILESVERVFKGAKIFDEGSPRKLLSMDGMVLFENSLDREAMASALWTSKSSLNQQLIGPWNAEKKASEIWASGKSAGERFSNNFEDLKKKGEERGLNLGELALSHNEQEQKNIKYKQILAELTKEKVRKPSDDILRIGHNPNFRKIENDFEFEKTGKEVWRSSSANKKSILKKIPTGIIGDLMANVRENEVSLLAKNEFQKLTKGLDLYVDFGLGNKNKRKTDGKIVDHVKEREELEISKMRQDRKKIIQKQFGGVSPPRTRASNPLEYVETHSHKIQGLTKPEDSLKNKKPNAFSSGLGTGSVLFGKNSKMEGDNIFKSSAFPSTLSRQKQLYKSLKDSAAEGRLSTPPRLSVHRAQKGKTLNI